MMHRVNVRYSIVATFAAHKTARDYRMVLSTMLCLDD